MTAEMTLEHVSIAASDAWLVANSRRPADQAHAGWQCRVRPSFERHCCQVLCLSGEAGKLTVASNDFFRKGAASVESVSGAFRRSNPDQK